LPGELFRTLRASQEAQDELAAHNDVLQVLDYFETTWTGASKYRYLEKLQLISLLKN
jgi:hypothetical protein